MTLHDAVTLIIEHVGKLLAERFSGTVTLSFHCRKGGIGRLSMNIDRDLTTEDLEENRSRPGKS